MVGVDVLGEGGHLAIVGDVENAILGDFGTQGSGVGDGFLQALGVAIREVQLGAFGGQFQRGRAADAAGGSGEKTTLAGEAVPLRQAGDITDLVAAQAGRTP